MKSPAKPSRRNIVTWALALPIAGMATQGCAQPPAQVGDIDALKSGGDKTQALREVIAEAARAGRHELDLGSGSIRLDSAIAWPPGLALICGDLTLDMSHGSRATDFPAPDYSGFLVDGGEPLRLSGLAADVPSNANELGFRSPQPLEQGDIVVIYNPSDSSFSPHRTYYRSGEMAKIARVDGSRIWLTTRTKAAYRAGDVQMWRLPRAIFALRGRLTIKGAPGALNAATLKRLSGATIAGKLICRASKPSIRALLIERCYGVSGEVEAAQATDKTVGLDYGVTVANSQNIDLRGEFDGERHGFAFGGGDYPLSIPNRNGRVTGTFSGRTPGIAAADTHGNCEDIYYEGEFHGGLAVGGNRTKWRGKVFLAGTGFAVNFSEINGLDHDFRGMEFYLEGAKAISHADYGLIDLDGASGTVMTDQVRSGGTLIFDEILIDSPTENMIARFKNRGFHHRSETLNVSLRNVRIKRLPKEGGDIRFDRLSGDRFNLVDLTGSLGLQNMGYLQVASAAIREVRRTGRSAC